jgi:hypothetical protein
MIRDVATNSESAEDMHQIEDVTEMMETQAEMEALLQHSPDKGEDSATGTVQTVATNSTR